jgi:DNA-binding response OmpR family regulator
MARVLAVVPDLMFASRVTELLAAAGHVVTVAPRPGAVAGADADVVVVDLVGDGRAAVELPASLDEAGRPAFLGVYGHTDPETRRRALEAGYDKVVPRSRFVREADALVRGLTPAGG